MATKNFWEVALSGDRNIQGDRVGIIIKAWTV